MENLCNRIALLLLVQSSSFIFTNYYVGLGYLQLSIREICSESLQRSSREISVAWDLFP